MHDGLRTGQTQIKQARARVMHTSYTLQPLLCSQSTALASMYEHVKRPTCNSTTCQAALALGTWLPPNAGKTFATKSCCHNPAKVLVTHNM